MGKQGFEMAAQVCTADDILWTKFLLLLPKLLYSRRNNHSNDCANLEMGDNWCKVLFKTIVEIVKNKLTSILSLKSKKIHEASTKGRQIYYTKEVARILWLKLRMNLYFADNCKVGFISSRYFLQSGYLIGSQSKFSNHWMTGNWSFSENLTNWESLHNPNYHMSMRNRKVISKWFINLISSVRWCLTLVSEYGDMDVDTKLRSTAGHDKN